MCAGSLYVFFYQGELQFPGRMMVWWNYNFFVILNSLLSKAEETILK